MTREIRAVILAAGKGTRMQSDLPKALLDVDGRPLARCIADACRDAGIATVYMVVGHKAEMVMETLGGGFTYVRQERQLGTAHALMQAAPLLDGYRGDLVVLVGDTPYITGAVIRNMIDRHRSTSAAATIMTAVYERTPPYGRVIRDAGGKVFRIVEEKDATPEELAVKEVMTSQYCLDAETALPMLDMIGNDNAQKEFNLTDIIAILIGEGHAVETVHIGDGRLVFGVNSIEDLKFVQNKM